MQCQLGSSSILVSDASDAETIPLYKVHGRGSDYTTN